MEVSTVQMRLNDILGTRLKVDGEMGPKTINAIGKLQVRYRIPDHGELCPLTFRVLSGSMTTQMTPAEQLILEAYRWNGVAEQGNNGGQIINMFQKCVGLETGSAWCMAFAVYCLDQITGYSMVRGLWKPDYNYTGHCLTQFRIAKPYQKSQIPRFGSLIIWQHGTSEDGHVGIVCYVGPDYLYTIEGNTAGTSAEIERNGGMVLLKKRPLSTLGKMRIVGFIDPWGVA
jgi:hypothetical protein